MLTDKLQKTEKRPFSLHLRTPNYGYFVHSRMARCAAAYYNNYRRSVCKKWPGVQQKDVSIVVSFAIWEHPPDADERK